jgi:hypothetical protein
VTETGLTIDRMDVTTCTDDEANGRYVLRIEDTRGRGDNGSVVRFGVWASSRFD